MGSRRLGGVSRVGAVLAACAVVFGILPASVAGAGGLQRPDRSARTLPQIVENTFRTLEEFGAPQRLIDHLRAAEDIDSETSVIALGAPDLNRDGVAEVIEWKLTYSLTFGTGEEGDPLGLEDEFETVITIRSGDSGKKLWRKKYDDFVIPVATNVGENGRKGVLSIGGILSFFGASVDRYLTFDSHRGIDGKRLWQRSYTAVQAGDYFTHIAEGTPIAIATTQALPGKATDVLISLATEVSTLFTYTMAVRAVVIDGKDGSDRTHPTIDVGVNWMPYASPVRDLDGDGLQDYAVTNSLGIDPGGPQEPPSVGGTVYARKGTDGSDLWITSGLTFYDFAWTGGLPDVIGGKAGEVGVLTPADPEWRSFNVLLLDGTFGALHWTKTASGFGSPGDVNRDGEPDVLLGTDRFSFENHRASFTATAVEGSGRRIFRRTHTWDFEGLPCPGGICSGGYGLGWGSSGDVHPNRVKETYVYFYAQQDPGPAQSHTIVADGHDGRALVTSDGNMYPAYGAVDGRGDDLFWIETRGGIAEAIVLDGRGGRELLRFVLQRTRGLLPRGAYAYADAFHLPGDRCDEVILNMWSSEGSFYAILDGGSAETLWSYWNGERKEKPRFTIREDHNHTC